MAAKYIIVLVIAAFVSKGHAVTEIFLPDHNINHILNPIIGVTMSIPKWWFDTLATCHITFPNGVMYEAYPNSNLPLSVFYLEATEPFNACGIGFRGMGVEYFGTYELWSMVDHADESRSMTRQKFHLNLNESEVEFPSQEIVQFIQ